MIAYYVCLFINQLSMNDGGDQGNMGSILSHMGVRNDVCEWLYSWTCLAVILLAIALLIQLICHETQAKAREGYGVFEQGREQQTMLEHGDGGGNFV